QSCASNGSGILGACPRGGGRDRCCKPSLGLLTITSCGTRRQELLPGLVDRAQGSRSTPALSMSCSSACSSLVTRVRDAASRGRPNGTTRCARGYRRTSSQLL